MARTRAVNITFNAPDDSPDGTVIHIERRDGVWVATVVTPVDADTTVRQVVRPEGLALDAQRTRVAAAIENLYDTAMRSAGYV